MDQNPIKIDFELLVQLQKNIWQKSLKIDNHMDQSYNFSIFKLEITVFYV